MKAVGDFIQTVEDELNLKGRPLVTLSYAQSLDGSIARRSGFPMQISGPDSLEVTHYLRSIHDGLLVGINTILSDDPQLTVRGKSGPDPRPIIVDRHLKTPPHAKVLKNPKKPWLCSGMRERKIKTLQFEDLGCRVFKILSDHHRWLSIRDLLSKLHAAGIRKLMVEGGATVIEQFIANSHVDVVVLTIAPVFIGGLNPMKRLVAESSEISDFPKLKTHSIEQLGKDILIWGQFLKP
jgi:riboflavin-specific deaminase-like protein